MFARNMVAHDRGPVAELRASVLGQSACFSGKRWSDNLTQVEGCRFVCDEPEVRFQKSHCGSERSSLDQPRPFVTHITMGWPWLLAEFPPVLDGLSQALAAGTRGGGQGGVE